MEIHADGPIDLTGLNKRDIRDIKRSMVIERQKLEQFGFDTETNECMMNAIYRALIVCKKINKENIHQRNTKSPYDINTRALSDTIARYAPDDNIGLDNHIISSLNASGQWVYFGTQK